MDLLSRREKQVIAAILIVGAILGGIAGATQPEARCAEAVGLGVG